MVSNKFSDFVASHVASPKAVLAVKLDPTASVRMVSITLTW